MDEIHDESLQERVERLEAVVAELQSMLKLTPEASKQKDIDVPLKVKETSSPPKASNHDQSAKSSSAVKPPPVQSQPGRKSFELFENMRKSEFWLNKIGIGLVLFGVAFLFKYSIDQGWLTPPVRVGFGLMLGISLIVTGIRIYSNRRHFSQVLIGGGIAIFYITGFATFQLFSLVSYQIAFAFMVLVTLLAFMLSLKQNEAVLSLIGAIGGLGTPFLLYTGAGSLPGLVGYTCVWCFVGPARSISIEDGAGFCGRPSLVAGRFSWLALTKAFLRIQWRPMMIVGLCSWGLFLPGLHSGRCL